MGRAPVCYDDLKDRRGNVRTQLHSTLVPLVTERTKEGTTTLMSIQHYDVLIIGSGFGGSVSAMRLAEKGYDVGVLEAGKRYETSDLPASSSPTGWPCSWVSAAAFICSSPCGDAP